MEMKVKKEKNHRKNRISIRSWIKKFEPLTVDSHLFSFPPHEMEVKNEAFQLSKLSHKIKHEKKVRHNKIKVFYCWKMSLKK